MSEWGKLSPEALARFEMTHGPVKVKRTTGPAGVQKAITAEAEFGEKLTKHPALHGAEFVREHAFHPARKWRFDYAFIGPKLAVEIEGQGRHQTYVGFRGDCEKYNAAVLHGWRVLRFVAAERKHIDEWVDTTVRALCGVDDA